MLGSPVLGTAVGLVLLFATTALLCSGVTEWLSNLLQLRAKYLLTGMRALLDAPEKPNRTTKDRKNTLHDRVKDPDQTKVAVRKVREQMATTSPVRGMPAAPMTTALWRSPVLTALQSRRVGMRKQGHCAIRNMCPAAPSLRRWWTCSWRRMRTAPRRSS